jgi:hypothetical protein
MDTYQARRQMRDLAQTTLELLDEAIREGASPTETLGRLRSMDLDARALLADAGYPAEAVWRGLQRAQHALQPGPIDTTLATQVADELRVAVETLDSLTSATSERDSDFRIIG